MRNPTVETPTNRGERVKRCPNEIKACMYNRPRRAKINALALGSRRRLPSTSAPPSHTLCSWTEKQEKLGKCRAN